MRYNLRSRTKPSNMDPVATLDPASILQLFTQFEPTVLASCLLVSKSWQSHALDQRLWERHNQELWANKVYVPDAIRQLPDRLAAYRTSLQDAQRVRITQEELTSFTWEFRFKHAAGPFWRVLMGDVPLRRWFHADNTMTGPPNDPLSSNEDGSYTWKFRKSHVGRKGCFVQVNSYPSLEPERTPDWGWQMHNMWVTFSANTLPHNPGKGQEPPHEVSGPQNEDMAAAAFAEAVAEAVAAAAAGHGLQEEGGLAALALQAAGVADQQGEGEEGEDSESEDDDEEEEEEE